MSKTIVTKSGSSFLTNINYEHIIGTLCREVGAKYNNHIYIVNCRYADMAINMTEEEVIETIERLQMVFKNEYNIEWFLEKYSFLFEKDFSVDNFKELLSNIIQELGDSKGYECLG